MEFDTELQQAKDRVVRRGKVEAMLATLNTQLTELTATEKQLRAVSKKEQKDVDRLEGFNPAAILNRIRDRKGENLTREQAEAYEAALRHEAAQAQLHEAEGQIAALKLELTSLANCENDYRNLMAQKRNWLKTNMPLHAAEISRREAAIRTQNSKIKELNEALDMGYAILAKLGVMEAELSGTAYESGNGNGYDRLDKVTRQMSDLPNLLRRYRIELSDVSVSATVLVKIESLIHASALYHNDTLTDIPIAEKAQNQRKLLCDVRAQVEKTQQKLTDRRTFSETQLDTLTEELKSYITTA